METLAKILFGGSKMAKQNNPELEKFLKEADKKFGEMTICEFNTCTAHVEAIPTGIPSLDYILGIGGLPRGRVIEIYGAEGAGKTTIAIRAMGISLCGSFLLLLNILIL